MAQRGGRELDTIDRQILMELRDDGRVSVSELARRVNVSRANAYARLKRLKRDGVIRGFTVSLDPQKAGFPVAALINLTLQQHRWRAARDEILTMPQVEYYAVTAGDHDVTVLARATSVEMIRDVILDRLDRIDGIQRTQTVFILDESPYRPVILPP